MYHGEDAEQMNEEGAEEEEGEYENGEIEGEIPEEAVEEERPNGTAGARRDKAPESNQRTTEDQQRYPEGDITLPQPAVGGLKLLPRTLDGR